MNQINIEELRKGGVVKLKEKDMFSVWVKTSCANLNSEQLRKVAELSKKYGRGIVHLATRQIPIIPFVRIEDVETIKKELEKIDTGLDRCGARVRNINVCYETKICPDVLSDPISLGEKLENFFYDSIQHKVKIGIAGCKKDCIGSRLLNDISFIGAGNNNYEVYLGGKLGLEPFVGEKMAEMLSEVECVKFVENYFDLLKREGKEKERAAHLIKRLGKETVKKRLTGNLKKPDVTEIECKTKLSMQETDKVILKIRVTCGEISSKQLRKIADLSDKYGRGFVHFTIYGSPEIPCVKKGNVESIRNELKLEDLEIIDKGIDNIQTCAGEHCTNGIVNTQSVLKKIEDIVNDIGFDNQDIKISAAGCPNSCGIAHLSDIGFLGGVEPEVDIEKCDGCGICERVCKKNAIRMIDNLAVIDKSRCSYCGDCIRSCPIDATREKRKGITVLVGGSYGEDTRLAVPIAGFLSEEEALRIAGKCLEKMKIKNVKAKTIIDDLGIDNFKKVVLQQ